MIRRPIICFMLMAWAAQAPTSHSLIGQRRAKNAVQILWCALVFASRVRRPSAIGPIGSNSSAFRLINHQKKTAARLLPLKILKANVWGLFLMRPKQLLTSGQKVRYLLNIKFEGLARSL